MLPDVNVNSKASPTSQAIVEAVLFDLDGTLLDTETLSDQAMILTLSEYVHLDEIDWTLKKSILGLRGTDWGKIVVDYYGLSEKLAPADLVADWERHLKLLCPNITKMEGALELVHSIRQQSVPLAVATSSNTDCVNSKRTGHSDLFQCMDVIICGDDSQVHRGKPAPDIYLLAAERLRVIYGSTESGSLNSVNETKCMLTKPSEVRRISFDPAHCLVFEDALTGVQAAVRAGMRVVACPDPRIFDDPTERARFEALTPFVYRSLSQFNISDWSFRAMLKH